MKCGDTISLKISTKIQKLLKEVDGKSVLENYNYNGKFI